MRNKDTLLRKQVDKLGIPEIWMIDREIDREERKRSFRRLLIGFLAAFVTIAAVIILVTNLWVSILRIEGSSMNPQLEMDDIVLAVNGNNPEKNDIIAFNHNNKLHIKRVIGTSGDEIEIDKTGVVSVNGKKLNEPYVSELALGICDLKFPYVVPAGMVFVLGDNRDKSMDSRNSQFGPVSKDQIIGKVIYSVWPLQNIS